MKFFHPALKMIEKAKGRSRRIGIDSDSSIFIDLFESEQESIRVNNRAMKGFSLVYFRIRDIAEAYSEFRVRYYQDARSISSNDSEYEYLTVNTCDDAHTIPIDHNNEFHRFVWFTGIQPLLFSELDDLFPGPYKQMHMMQEITDKVRILESDLKRSILSMHWEW